MKIMGLDYGSVTVGVAISDSMLLTAQPVEVIKRKSMIQVVCFPVNRIRISGEPKIIKS